MDPILLKNALTDPAALEQTLEWKPFRPGIEISTIYPSIDGGPSAAFLRYQPGSAIPRHFHPGFEHIFILRGSQTDRSGENHAGTIIVNPPGTSHQVASATGCLVLIIWDKPVVLFPEPAHQASE